MTNKIDELMDVVASNFQATEYNSYSKLRAALEAALKPDMYVVGYINEMDKPILTSDTRRIDLACCGGCTRLYGDAK